MSLGVIASISCVLSAITTAIFSAFLFVLLQSGGRGVRALFDRFTGGGERESDEKRPQRDVGRSRPSISSGDVLRQRAQELEFDPAAGYGAQSASSTGGLQPRQPTLTSRDPLQPPQATPPQSGQPGQPRPSMPRLSSSRPFQPGGGPPAPLQQPGQRGQAPQQGGQQGNLPPYRPGLQRPPGQSAQSQTGPHYRGRDDRRREQYRIYDDADFGDGDFGDILDLDG